MHGFFFTNLRNYIGDKFRQEELDHDMWVQIFQRAGMEYTIFTPLGRYDVVTAARLFVAAAEFCEESPADFLRGYGRYIAPLFVELYATYFRGVDLSLFSYLRYLKRAYDKMESNGGVPPRIHFTEMPGSSEATLYINSGGVNIIPDFCQLSIGMIEGLSDYCKEKVEVAHAECAADGAPFCSFDIRLCNGRSPRQERATMRPPPMEGDPEADDG